MGTFVHVPMPISVVRVDRALELDLVPGPATRSGQIPCAAFGFIFTKFKEFLWPFCWFKF